MTTYNRALSDKLSTENVLLINKALLLSIVKFIITWTFWLCVILWYVEESRFGLMYKYRSIFTDDSATTQPAADRYLGCKTLHEAFSTNSETSNLYLFFPEVVRYNYNNVPFLQTSSAWSHVLHGNRGLLDCLRNLISYINLEKILEQLYCIHVVYMFQKRCRLIRMICQKKYVILQI